MAKALAPLGTDANKPFLETAPYLIAVFAQPFSIGPDGGRVKHYYVAESVGIAVASSSPHSIMPASPRSPIPLAQWLS